MADHRSKSSSIFLMPEHSNFAFGFTREGEETSNVQKHANNMEEKMSTNARDVLNAGRQCNILVRCMFHMIQIKIKII